MRRLLALVAVIALAGCFEPDEPLCAFQCGDNNLCPNDYTCLADGYCHLHGQPGDCMFADASAVAVDGGEDMTMPGDAAPDLTSNADLAGFQSFPACSSPAAYGGATTGLTIQFGNSLGTTYAPACVQLSLGGTDGGSVAVNWAPASGGSETFANHPLNPSTLGTSGNPIPLTNSGSGPATATFTSPGFFPFYCGIHGSNSVTGMAGVVWITP